MIKILFLFLLLTSNSLWSKTQELTLYFIPSPLGMDWSSPVNLTFSAVKNIIQFKPRFMGHVFVELKCGETHELTGMTSKTFDYMNQLIIEGKGLGILYHSFEGRLEDKNLVQAELKTYLKSGHTNFGRFLLNEKQCQRVTRYLQEYRKNNIGRHYGLANRPRYGEGAGCTAFGVSFLDVLGLLDQDMKESWSQTINVPLEFSGPPVNQRSVNLLSVLMNAHAWAPENTPHKKLTFWDPDKMHQWVKQKVRLKQNSYSILKVENAEGVVFDKGHFPAPEGPIWLQHLDPIYRQ